jgi:ribosomal protein S12 methylthiotransferase accessory factor YcaO
MATQHRFRPVTTPVPNFVFEASSSPLISEPSVFGASDDSRIQGHGFGYGPDIHLKAFGEYMERFVAFRNIASSGSATIDELNLSRETKCALKAAITEACGAGQLGACLATHRFDTAEVLDMRTGENVHLPRVLFTLHATTDQRFVPTRDTSGSALHPNKETAFQNAVLEFVERQSLAAMWASGRCQALSVLQPGCIADQRIKVLLQRLNTRGTLSCYNISFLKGAHVLFVVYRARSESDFVQFACGACAALTWQAALAKALVEVWQTSLLLLQMEFFDTTGYGGSELKEGFQNANRKDFDFELEMAPLSRVNDEDGSPDELKKSLFDITPSLFAFSQSHYVGLNRLTFCKIFSPDFFIHMNPGPGNNNQNRWLAIIAGGRPLRLTAMPFS